MKYFKLFEFDSPDMPGSGSEMVMEFLNKLEKAREIADIPFKINSGFRSENHNKEVGGSPNSSHLRGWAADISSTNSTEREKIITSLIIAGFRRLGIAKTFIHVDCDPEKKNFIWLYY